MPDLNNLRILVTGGAGFIGSHVVEDLVRQGARVTVYDDFSSGYRENLKEVQADVRIVEGDILDFEALSNAIAGHQIVSHQAAQLEIIKCIDHPVHDLTINTAGTVNVLQACIEQGVEAVINASSACVYGQAQSVPEAESHPLKPNWPYGASKLSAELYADYYQREHGIPVYSLRYSIVFGSREWYGRVLTVFLKRLLEKKHLVVFGDGGQQRDFVHVSDVARLNTLLVRRFNNCGEPLNVSSGTGTSVRELAEKVAGLSQGTIDIVHESIQPGESSALVEGRVRLPSELQTMILSPNRATQLLGWKPQVGLLDGIVEELDWLADHISRWTRFKV
ncbi:MAG: SDR family NAD(P)-dependent oxidoreductase [Acidobacteria bacterium]|nr:SDR family NAD(P)-dependent oxidoreductase [Acidobacteriota bacterium]